MTIDIQNYTPIGDLRTDLVPISLTAAQKEILELREEFDKFIQSAQSQLAAATSRANELQQLLEKEADESADAERRAADAIERAEAAEKIEKFLRHQRDFYEGALGKCVARAEAAEAEAGRMRAALVEVEKWMANEGVLHELWENCDIGDYEDEHGGPLDYEMTLANVRNFSIPWAEMGVVIGQPEHRVFTLYRQVLAALAGEGGEQ